MKKQILFLLLWIVGANYIYSQVTYYPECKSSIEGFEIMSILITEDKTIVNIKLGHVGDIYKFYFSSKTYIQKSNTKKSTRYMITNFVNHKLDQYYDIPEGEQEYKLILEFEKIPPGVFKIDIIEPDQIPNTESFIWKKIEIENQEEIKPENYDKNKLIGIHRCPSCKTVCESYFHQIFKCNQCDKKFGDLCCIIKKRKENTFREFNNYCPHCLRKNKFSENWELVGRLDKSIN